MLMRYLLALLLIATLTACDAATPGSSEAPYTQAEVDALVDQWTEDQPTFAEVTALYLAAFAKGTTPDFDFPEERPEVIAASGGMMQVAMLTQRWHRDGHAQPPEELGAAYRNAVDQFMVTHAAALRISPDLARGMAQHTLQTSLKPDYGVLLPDEAHRLYYLQMSLDYGPIQEWSVWMHHLEQLPASYRHEVSAMARQALIHLAAMEQVHQEQAVFGERFFGWLAQHAPSYFREGPDDETSWDEVRREVEAPWSPREHSQVVDGQLVRPSAQQPVDVDNIRTRLTVLL